MEEKLQINKIEEIKNYKETKEKLSYLELKIINKNNHIFLYKNNNCDTDILIDITLDIEDYELSLDQLILREIWKDIFYFKNDILVDITKLLTPKVKNGDFIKVIYKKDVYYDKPFSIEKVVEFGNFEYNKEFSILISSNQVDKKDYNLTLCHPVFSYYEIWKPEIGDIVIGVNNNNSEQKIIHKFKGNYEFDKYEPYIGRPLDF